MTRNTEIQSMEAEMLHVLGLDTENATRGNVAAHVYHVTHGGGMEGINLGWAGQDASTDFLLSVMYVTEALWHEILDTVAALPIPIVGPEIYRGTWEEMRDGGRDVEAADGAVPIYTRELLAAAIELGRTSLDDMSDSGIAPETVRSFEDIARITMFELAEEIIHGLIGLLIAVKEEV